MPDEWAQNHPDYPRGEPTMTRRFGNGETWLDVLVRLQPVLARADELAAGGTALFVTHAEAELPFAC